MRRADPSRRQALPRSRSARAGRTPLGRRTIRRLDPALRSEAPPGARRACRRRPRAGRRVPMVSRVESDHPAEALWRMGTRTAALRRKPSFRPRVGMRRSARQSLGRRRSSARIGGCRRWRPPRTGGTRSARPGPTAAGTTAPRGRRMPAPPRRGACVRIENCGSRGSWADSAPGARRCCHDAARSRRVMACGYVVSRRIDTSELLNANPRQDQGGVPCILPQRESAPA